MEEPMEPAAKKPRFEQMQVQKVKEQLAARLDAPKEASVTVDNIKWEATAFLLVQFTNV